MKGWKDIYNENGHEKKVGVAIFIWNKIDFKIKTVTGDKGGHYILIKETILKEDKTFVNIYPSHMGALKFIKQLIANIKELNDRNTMLIRDFNT